MEWPDGIVFTEHFVNQVKAKGFTAEQIIGALRNPDKVTDVRRYPGQKRYCGSGVAVVMSDNRAVTVYLDGVITPLRPDQMNDPKAYSNRCANQKAKRGETK